VGLHLPTWGRARKLTPEQVADARDRVEAGVREGQDRAGARLLPPRAL